MVVSVFAARIHFSKKLPESLPLKLSRPELFSRLFSFAAPLCATRVCRFSEEKLGQMLSVEFQAMMLLVKSKAEDAS